MLLGLATCLLSGLLLPLAAPVANSSSLPSAATATGGDDNIPGALGGASYQGFTTSNAGGVGGAGTFYGSGAGQDRTQASSANASSSAPNCANPTA